MSIRVVVLQCANSLTNCQVTTRCLNLVTSHMSIRVVMCEPTHKQGLPTNKVCRRTRSAHEREMNEVEVSGFYRKFLNKQKRTTVD